MNWSRVVERAAALVRGYTIGVTLRQLFYLLVSEQAIKNTMSAYKRLSSLTAAARRAGMFPSLVDLGREIRRPLAFAGPQAGLRALCDQYRRDRTAGQEVAVYVGAEKKTMIGLLEEWFDAYGFPIVAVGGYSSQTFTDDIVADVDRDAETHGGRSAVLIYAGDHDRSGHDIQRDLEKRTQGRFSRIVRVAITDAQVQQYHLPTAPAKEKDVRGAFMDIKVQVELEALRPDVLRGLYLAEIERYWSQAIYDDVLAQEAEDVSTLETLARGF